MEVNGKRIIISRTDSIGDVMLTLPICAWIKRNFSDTHLIFLGKGYTRDIVTAYELVDEFIDWNDFLTDRSTSADRFKALNADIILHVFPSKSIARLAKKAGISERIGTSHRLFHLSTCNHRVNFTRRGSDLHESQLNHELLRPLGLKSIPSLQEITDTTKYFRRPQVGLPEDLERLNDITILHPRSQGSAKEWPIKKYVELAEKLVEAGKNVLFTGTENEGAQFREQLPVHEQINDTTGQLSLQQLMILISKADNLVACSTGPLHIAGYYGVNTIGLFSPKRPIHPGRWKALGDGVQIVVKDENCPKCAAGKECSCIEEISVDSVWSKLKK